MFKFNRLFIVYISLFFIFFSPLGAFAKEVKGQVSYSYKGGTFSSSPSSSDKKNAVEAAKLAAWNQYVTSFNISKQQQYQKIEKEVLNNLDKYVTSYRVIAEDIDKNMKLINMVVRVDINENRLNADLKSTTTAGSMSSGDGSVFSFVFVAREVTESKVFRAKDTNIAQVDAATSASKNSSADDGLKVTQRASYTAKSTTGGNTVLKSSQNKHGLLASTDFDASFNEILTQMGYETVDYSDVVANCGGASVSSIKQAFVTQDELPDALRKKAIAAARECDVKYFSVGFMNVSAPQIDPVSGDQKVIVSVNGMVWNISKKLPRKVGSVGPVQFIGLGPDQDTARRNALKLAAQSAAETISNQLGSKNLY